MDMCTIIEELLEVVSSMPFILRLHGGCHQDKLERDSIEQTVMARS
jgi:hypothetical protein